MTKSSIFSKPFDYFVPVGAEKCGAFSPQGLRLIKEITIKISEVMKEKMLTCFLL